MTPALVLAFALMTAAPQTSDGGGEPLPPGAPTDSYELAAWCYGALDEYLTIYDKVKPDLRDMDRMFGTSVVEAEPYQSDMSAAHDELKMIGDAVTDAEKASPQPIAQRGAAALRQGASIWSLAEARPHRELARAWMLWALPDACDANARDLTTKSLLLGRALNYNTGSQDQPPSATPPQVAGAPQPPAASALDSAEQPPATTAPAEEAPAPQQPASDLAAAPAPQPPPAEAVAVPTAAQPAAQAAAAPTDVSPQPEPAAAPAAVGAYPNPDSPSAAAAAPPAQQAPTQPATPPASDQSQEPTL